LPNDYDPAKTCQTHFGNRLIYSQKATMEETKNNWLVYRPVSYADLQKNFGPICSIDGIEDNRLLVRFTHKSLLYNVMATLRTEAGIASLGNPAFFSQPPLDFLDSDSGFAGSRHKLLIKSPHGHIWVDATRGQVILLKGTSVDNLATRGMHHWLQSNLPFHISRSLQDVPIDNHFGDFGLTGVFDTRYNRLLLTKKDYLPLEPGILYAQEKFYFDNKQVDPSDSRYFCNKSWTLSYSFNTGAWVAFHSYVPYFYIGHPTYFQTGIHSGIYDHNLAHTFGSFYGQPAPYILEYPLSFGGRESIIGSFSDYTTVLQYDDRESYFEVEDGIYFNQAVIYSDSECSGLLNLVPRPKGNLSAYMSYPRYNRASKDILVTKSDHLFNFNQFWNIVKSTDKPFFTTACDRPSMDKIFLDENLDYSPRHYNKARFRSRDARIRLVYNSKGPYKLISNFLLTDTQNSFK
ncbi:MAG TPA: hypothetical protein VJ720_06375, partial [Chitinophaga sp.]|nr:hypothetical protein [Chitinophaga sp.]